MNLKETAKSLLERCGYRVLAQSRFPVGLDDRVDIAKLSGGRATRVIFDIGANVGNTARRYAKFFRKSQIMAFEPFPRAYSMLCENTSRIPTIKCYQVALGSKAESRNVRQVENSEWNSLVPGLNREGALDETIAVEVRTVDDVCREHEISHIDILKTDTEGFDLEVLAGSRRMLGGGAIDFVFSEVGFVSGDARHTEFFALYKLLEDAGFSFVSLYDLRLGKCGIEFCNALFASQRRLCSHELLVK